MFGGTPFIGYNTCIELMIVAIITDLTLTSDFLMQLPLIVKNQESRYAVQSLAQISRIGYMAGHTYVECTYHILLPDVLSFNNHSFIVELTITYLDYLK